MKKFMKVLKIAEVSLIGIVLILGVIYVFLPKGPKDLMEFDDPYQVSRESVNKK